MYNETVIDPIALLFTILMCTIIFTTGRKKILIPLILVACFITKAQRIVIFTVDFPMLRILLVVGFIRIIMRGEKRSFVFNKIDKLLLYWSISRIIAHTILWGSFGAFMNGLGELVDTLGAYFFIRLALYDLDEYETIIKSLVVVSIFISIFMIYEQNTGRNLFSIFGGVSEYTQIREGRLRSQGTFLHSILAGTFGATLIPLSWGLWNRNKKFIAFLGYISGSVITLTSSSSGPIVTFACALFGLFFWRYRDHLKKARYAGVFLLVFLHLVMKAPVWHLISRVDLVGGSTGYHRFLLIDNAIRRFREWAFVGTRSTAHWGQGQNDVTNAYVFEGIYGGVIPLILFVLIIKKLFDSIGLALKRSAVKQDSHKFIWSLGVALFAHVVTFISVTYFDQTIFFYYMLVAMISSLNNLPSILSEEKEVNV